MKIVVNPPLLNFLITFLLKGSYIVDDELMKNAPSNMVVLHPLPRSDEISVSIDGDPRSAYFRQMENGMFVRMALLRLILGRD